MPKQNESIEILNKMIKIIDEKGAKYKKEMKTMPTSRFYAEKKIILDMIEDATKLAQSIKPPSPGINDLLADFRKLAKDISGLRQS